MKTNIKALSLFILGILLLNSVYAQTLNSTWVDGKNFCMTDENSLVSIWGAGNKIPGVYFDELLPAFFERKLTFNQANFKTSKFKWVFTGRNGGVTITVSADSIEMVQRYYDSFGFNKLKDQKIIANRYSQSEFAVFKTSLKGELVNSITLQVNHGLGLKLLLNDRPINEQICQIDLSRHQLQIEGVKVNICGKLQLPATSDAIINIDPNKKYQEILGFGGITSLVAYNMLSEDGKNQWWNFLKEYNILIQREYPIGKKLKSDYSNWDNLEDATPHYYGDNFPNGEISDFAYNKKIQDNGGIVVFEFWQFPEWVYNKEQANEKKIDNIPDYDKYTEAIINYCNTAKQKTGKAPAIIGIQNEVVQSEEVWHQLTLHLRKALDNNGYKDVKIHMYNSSNLNTGISALKAFTSDQKVWDDIDYTSSNLYDNQKYFTNPDGFDKVIQAWNVVIDKQPVKPFLSVEMCVNDNKYQSGSYGIAFLMGELYHKNMVNLNATALMYCWLLINNVQPSFSASRSLFEVNESDNNLPKPSSYQLRVFGAFSRHILKGFQRTEATSSDSDLLVSSYSKGKDVTVILLNRGTAPKKINVTAIRKNISMMEVVSPYYENRISKISEQKELILQPGSIVTLY